MGRLSFLGLGPWAKTELSASVVKIKLSRSEILLALFFCSPLTRLSEAFGTSGLIKAARRSSRSQPRRPLRALAGCLGAIYRRTRPQPATLRVVETGSSRVRQTQTGLHSSTQNIRVADSRALTGWRAAVRRWSQGFMQKHKKYQPNSEQTLTVLVFFNINNINI